ncbi:hypothetical protein Y032_0169g224 [Ancylostoma ceylanicum]|uniref:Uncharacterized protein n=1 Tax=Ancylostoma ceylanicum TaxID=53326 RepID=A0A016SW75_9BILA|nr:hypothetical protein Y032_0169g224 [Ancylostoma ceylanicum]
MKFPNRHANWKNAAWFALQTRLAAQPHNLIKKDILLIVKAIRRIGWKQFAKVNQIQRNGKPSRKNT